MLSTIAEIIRDLLIFVGVIAALLVAFVVVVSKMLRARECCWLNCVEL
jgi:hypothetical protein